MTLHFPIIELVDRYVIAKIKYGKTCANDLELRYYREQMDQFDLSEVLGLIQDLESIHLEIWDLEKELKSGQERDLPLAEIGLRAIQIRNWNNQRIMIKNHIAQKLGCSVREIKKDHLSGRPLVSLRDFATPFDAIKAFQDRICEFTGAPYCVVTDCCTHAIEIALRIERPRETLRLPAYTYLSVLMTMHKIDIPYELVDQHWTDYYQIENSRVWDCARYFARDMYRPKSIQCISFGRTKPLEIGLGGCILTDDRALAERATRMVYDGRDIWNYSPWASQKQFDLGFHYYLRPEECVIGINKLMAGEFTAQLPHHFDYPDCRTITINR